jgi:uncharacterized protein YjbI with pentapeptide repeats
MRQTWKTYLLYGSGIVVGGILLFILIQTVRAKNTGFETKTLWDWMELLIIPAVLAVGAFYLQSSERTVEREIATDRQHEAALQAYLDKMADLLLDKKLSQYKSEEVWNVVRFRTLTVLRGLNVTRNRLVVRFLRDIELIGKAESTFFLGADLEGAELSGVDLRYTNMEGANFEGTDLKAVDLSYTNLRGSNLKGANLQGAFLIEANLEYAVLEGVNLQEAFMMQANLQHALLHKANLQRANLYSANLQEADLKGAILKGADLESADLEGSEISDDQLRTVKSLKGATMRDGTKHN